VSKPEIEWDEKGEAEDYDRVVKFLSLLGPNTKAAALVSSLRNSKFVEHAAKDLWRAPDFPILPIDESHVDEVLKGINKARRWRPFSSFAGAIATGLPLIVADGYHRICGVYYFDESAPIPCRIVDIDHRCSSSPRRQPVATRMNTSAEPIDALRRGITEYLVLAPGDPQPSSPEAKGPARGRTLRGAKARAPVWAMNTPMASPAPSLFRHSKLKMACPKAASFAQSGLRWTATRRRDR
jgi:hypothetical protein